MVHPMSIQDQTWDTMDQARRELVDVMWVDGGGQ